MASASQRPKGRDGALSTLDIVIQGLNLAADSCGLPPAQAAFGSANALLTMIRVRLPKLCDELLAHVSTANNQDYVNLGLSCSGVCKALDRGLNGRD
jgi:hypothetical protein